MDDPVYITIEQLPKENIYKHIQMALYVKDLLRIVIINSNVDNIQILGLKFSPRYTQFIILCNKSCTYIAFCRKFIKYLIYLIHY